MRRFLLCVVATFLLFGCDSGDYTIINLEDGEIVTRALFVKNFKESEL